MPARKLIAIEANLRRLEETLRAGFWSCDLRSGAMSWSPGFYALFGLRADTVMPDATLARSLLHPQDQKDWTEVVALARRQRQPDRTVRIIRTDGQMIRVRSRYAGQFDRGGAMVAIFGTLVDISEQHAEREAAARGRAFAQSLHALTGRMAWRSGPQGGLADGGDWARATGAALPSEDAPVGAADAIAAIHPDDRDLCRTAWETGISERMPIHFRARIRQDSGRYAEYETRALPCIDDDGEVVEWHGCSLPVTNAAMQDTQTLTSAQIRAARAMIDWSGPNLAVRSGVSFSTIKRMEKSEGLVKPESIRRVRRTLEDAGIRFGTGDGEISVALVGER